MPAIQRGVDSRNHQGFDLSPLSVIHVCNKEDGEREATLKIARTNLQNGIDRHTVMKMTGLTEDDLAQKRH